MEACHAIRHLHHVDNSLSAKESGWHYIEAPAQQVLNAMLKDEQWTDDAAKASAVPIRSANLLIPAGLKVIGPKANPVALRVYMERITRRASRSASRRWSSTAARHAPCPMASIASTPSVSSSTSARLCGELAAKAGGVTVVLEPLNRRECNIVNTVAEAMEVVRQVNHPNFLCMLDTYQFWTRERAAGEPRRGHEVDQARSRRRQGRPRRAGRDAGTRTTRRSSTLLRKLDYRGTVSVDAPSFQPSGYFTVAEYLKTQWKRADLAFMNVGDRLTHESHPHPVVRAASQWRPRRALALLSASLYAVWRMQSARPRGDRPIRRVGLRRSRRARAVAGHDRRTTRSGPAKRWLHQSPLPIRTAYLLVPAAMKIVGPEADLPQLTAYLDARRPPRGEIEHPHARLRQRRGAGDSGGLRSRSRRTQLLDFCPRRRDSRRRRPASSSPWSRSTARSAISSTRSAEVGDDTCGRRITGTFACCSTPIISGARRAAGERRGTPRRSIAHVHVADLEGRTPPGESGTSDYRPIFRAAQAAGYDGLISVESKSFDADSGARSLEFLKRQWNES